VAGCLCGTEVRVNVVLLCASKFGLELLFLLHSVMLGILTVFCLSLAISFRL